MRRLVVSVFIALMSASVAMSRGVTVHAFNRDASSVFAELMRQTGKNFIYSPDVLKGLKITVKATDEPLERVLRRMFSGTDVIYRIKGDNVMLLRRVRPAKPSRPRLRPKNAPVTIPDTVMTHELGEVTVVDSRNNVSAGSLSDAYRLSASSIRSTPVIFGESDVVKTLQLQPGVSVGIEGMAGMYVHGGDNDENQFLLDRIPLYQVNHLGGLFSAFNAEALHGVDFYKSSFPARMDGRLSSFMDVHSKDGSFTDGHHGSFRLGLTSGAFNIDGSVGGSGRTSYSLAVRRSWLDLISTPLLALVNSVSDDEKVKLRYAFMDLNAKASHRFSERSKASVMLYFSDDLLHGGSESGLSEGDTWYDNDKTRMHWGNLVVSGAWDYVFSPTLSGDMTAGFTRYFSRMKHDYYNEDKSDSEVISSLRDVIDNKNTITDWILQADFRWCPSPAHKVDFGVGYTRHSFLPSRTVRTLERDGENWSANDGASTYRGNEVKAYMSDDWRVSSRLWINAGVHLSLFNLDGTTHGGVSPRLSVRYLPVDGWTLKASYSRTTQYVHQLSQSFISLPTDQWIPVTGGFKPLVADKVSAGVGKLFGDKYMVSAEAFYKWMHNLIEYRDEYYLIPPSLMWDAQLTSGDGTAKGFDFKLERTVGALTGHLSYSLLWADRTFADRNHGKTYPARFDNRHKINFLLNWRVSGKCEINASWTGMSGNRFTLPTQMWDAPGFADGGTSVPLDVGLNNYRLPFYHRLDLGVTVRNRRGFWNFSLYNAYCNMNVVAVRRDERKGRPVFQQFHLFPIIPSFSYTWIF